MMKDRKQTGQVVREDLRKAHQPRDLIVLRKETIRISWERAFQTEKHANRKVLKCLHIQGRRPVSEDKRGRKGAERKRGTWSHRDLQVIDSIFIGMGSLSSYTFFQPQQPLLITSCTHFTCTYNCHSSLWISIHLLCISPIFSTMSQGQELCHILLYIPRAWHPVELNKSLWKVIMMM